MRLRLASARNAEGVNHKDIGAVGGGQGETGQLVQIDPVNGEAEQDKGAGQHDPDIEPHDFDRYIKRNDDGRDADDGEKIEDVGTDDIADGHGAVLADRGHDGGRQLGKRGAERDDGQGDDGVADPPGFGNGGRAFDGEMGAERQADEAEHDIDPGKTDGFGNPFDLLQFVIGFLFGYAFFYLVGRRRTVLGILERFPVAVGAEGGIAEEQGEQDKKNRAA